MRAAAQKVRPDVTAGAVCHFTSPPFPLTMEGKGAAWPTADSEKE